MTVVIITVILLGLISVVLLFTGWLTAGINILFRLAYNHHKRLRRELRPSRIFLIRHGESQANLDNTLYARIPDSDIGLTDNGHRQAMAAGQKLRSMIGEESMYVYMSPYLRSKQTWENIKKAFLPTQIITERQDPRLREVELGNIDNLPNLSKELEEQKRTKRFFYRFSGGESGADVYDRASLFIDTLIHEMDTGYHDSTQNIVIVSHGFFIRLILMRYFRWTIDRMMNTKKMENCEIIELQKVDGVYTLNGETKPPTETS